MPASKDSFKRKRPDSDQSLTRQVSPKIRLVVSKQKQNEQQTPQSTSSTLDSQRITRSRTGSLPKGMSKYKFEELLNEPSSSSAKGNRRRLSTRKNSKSHSGLENDNVTALPKRPVENPKKSRVNIINKDAPSFANPLGNYEHAIADDDEESSDILDLSSHKRMKLNHDVLLGDETLSVGSSPLLPSYDFNSEESSDVLFGFKSGITFPDLRSNNQNKDSQDIYSFSDTLSSSVSSPRDFDDLISDNITLPPFQPFESLNDFDHLDPLGPSPLDAVIEQGEENFDTHFPSAVSFEPVPKVYNETLLDSYYDQQLKFLDNEVVETLQATPSSNTAQTSFEKEQEEQLDAEASPVTTVAKPKKQNKKPKPTGINVTTPGVQSLSAALSSSIPSMHISELNEALDAPKPISISSTQLSADLFDEQEVAPSTTSLEPRPVSTTTTTKAASASTVDSGFPSVLTLEGEEALDQLSSSCPPSADLGENLTNATSESLTPASHSASEKETDDENAIFALWPQGQRERSNSFASLVNRSSFKQLARALSKNPSFFESFSDTFVGALGGDADKSHTNAATHASAAGTSSSGKTDVVDDFLNLVDEPALQSSLEEPAAASEKDANRQTQKIPLCGYRYRNQSMRIPNGALNPKKILAALASISTENEKLVASFPTSAAASSLSSSKPAGFDNYAARNHTQMKVPESIRSYNSAGALSSTPTTNNNMSTTSFNFGSNSSTPQLQNSVISNKDSSAPTAFEFTRSALEHYQQAVVAAAGLNRHSLYSGKGREMIAGSTIAW